MNFSDSFILLYQLLKHLPAIKVLFLLFFIILFQYDVHFRKQLNGDPHQTTQNTKGA